MRWDHLFHDLETQLEVELQSAEQGLHAEEERMRIGRLALRERLVALAASPVDRGQRVAVTLVSGQRIVVHPVAVGRDWFSAEIAGESARPRDCVVPLGAVASLGVEPRLVAVSLTPRDAASSETIGLVLVLRDLCRRRLPVDVVLDASELHGTIDRVAGDHLDLAVHERGTPRRESVVREVVMVSLAALRMVRL